MKVRRRLTGSRLLIALSLAAMSMVVAAPVRAADDPACSQSQFPGQTGAATVLAHGTTSFTAAQVFPDTLGGGTLTWSLKGVIVGPSTTPENGDLAGFLTATVDWNDAKPTTTFASDCVRAVGVHFKFIEGMYDGTAENLPAGGASAQGDGSTSRADIQLMRVRAGIADLKLHIGDPVDCNQIVSPPGFLIQRPSARAKGSKIGDGGRGVVCPT